MKKKEHPKVKKVIICYADGSEQTVPGNYVTGRSDDDNGNPDPGGNPGGGPG